MNPFGFLGNIIRSLFRGVKGSFAFNLVGSAFSRMRTAVTSPFRRIMRRVGQFFNVNMITAKLMAPITKKVRKIMSAEAKSPEDYYTVGRFWISKTLVFIVILCACAAVFLYFGWLAPAVEDTTTTENLITSVYYDYDDMDLGEYSGKANIRAANGEVVYTGDISAGVCTGNGTLWNQDGVLIYEGAFANNKFEGNGTLYYSSGSVQYTGEFQDNNFSGAGILYYQDGSVQYEGSFENGVFSGEGVLYNEDGVMIYEGSFQSGLYHGSGVSYYYSGIKRYEGEFYMGRAQGQGTLYSSAGRTLFSGPFARDEIHYEALLGMTLEDAEAMFQETPVVYFSDGGTSFLFETAQVILKTDCLVELRISEEATSGSGVWYMPDEEGDTLPETEDSQLDPTEEETDASEEDAVAGALEELRQSMDGMTAEEAEELENLPVDNIYHIYYYLATDEWQREADLDKSAVTITGVTTYQADTDVSFLEEYEMTPENGAASLQECVAIERIRLTEPTAFSSINYEVTTLNRTYLQVSGINLANAIYEEVYDLDGVRYRLCYQMDTPNELKFVTVENY